MTDLQIQLLFTKSQDFKLDVVEKMHRYGGSFVKTLADLIVVADHKNLVKISNTWLNYIKDYLPDPAPKGGE